MSHKLNLAMTPPTSSETVSASTAKDYSLNPTTSIFANTTGAITARLALDSSNVSLPVVQGAQYFIQIAEVPSSNATGFIAMWSNK